MLMVIIGKRLLIFNDVTFKLAVWWPYWIFWFPDCNFSLALNMNSKLQCPNTFVYRWQPIDFQWPHFLNGCLVAILDFSVSGLCRRHGFGSVTQVCFGISVLNFMYMSFVAVDRSLKIFIYVAFKMAALWYWTMFNCNPPIAPCHPLPWGGGILVDLWSTISSYISVSDIVRNSPHHSSSNVKIAQIQDRFDRDPYSLKGPLALTTSSGRVIGLNLRVACFSHIDESALDLEFTSVPKNSYPSLRLC